MSSSPSTTTSSLPLTTDSASIAAFNRGPLTSVFTPPSTCLSTLTFMNSMYFGHYNTYFDPSCFPTSISSSQTKTSSSDTWAMYYYSPGQCPSGWYHATTMKSSFLGAATYALSLGADTTAVLCCPSGYAYPTDNGVGHQCVSTFTTSTTLVYYSPSIVANTLVQGSTAITTIDHQSYNIWGDGIPVWWQSSDLAAFATASRTTSSLNSSTVTNSATSASIPSNSSISSPTPLSDTSGLSTGSKAAIGVCIPLAAIAILLSIFFWFRSRRQKVPTREIGPEYVPEISNETHMSEMYSSRHNAPNMD